MLPQQDGLFQIVYSESAVFICWGSQHINLKTGKLMKKSVRIVGAIALAIAFTQLVFAQSSATLGKEDAGRLTAVAQANIAEVEAGKLALQKSSNLEVGAFTQLMINDHTKGIEETRKVAAAKNLTLPTEADAPTRKWSSN